LVSYINFVGNTANQAVAANTVGFMGPTLAAFTAYALQLPSTGPTTALPILNCPTPVSSVSACSFVASGGSVFPVAVSGTVTSGGIPCFNSTTNEQTSVALTVNVLIKGGGAGACPTNSSVTDNATNVTTTDAGGYVAPVFVANGATAGFIDFPQGSTSAAVAPCNVATSICRQAPAAVTSYVLNLAGAAPTNNNSAELFSNASPGVGSFAKMQQTAITSGSAYTNATTTFSNVVGGSGQTLQFSVEASTNYAATCHVMWQGSASTTGPKFQWTGPASPTAVVAYAHSPVTTSTYLDAPATAFSTSMPDTGTITTATNFVSDLTLGLVNGVNAGTVTLQAAANGAGTLTIQPGSFCVLQ